MESGERWERYRAGGVVLMLFTFPGAKSIYRVVEDVLKAAKSSYIAAGVYHVVFFSRVVDPRNTFEMAGATYSRRDPEWENAWGIVKSAFTEPVDRFIVLSKATVLWWHRRYGWAAAALELADTLHHEIFHASTGVEHEPGKDDQCLQEAERFIDAAIRSYEASWHNAVNPLSAGGEQALRRSAMARRAGE